MGKFWVQVGRKLAGFDLRAAGASAFSVLLGLSWHLPLVRQMEGCEVKEQDYWCDLVAEQSHCFFKRAGNSLFVFFLSWKGVGGDLP